MPEPPGPIDPSVGPEPVLKVAPEPVMAVLCRRHKAIAARRLELALEAEKRWR
jgi:hypothetical protein